MLRLTVQARSFSKYFRDMDRQSLINFNSAFLGTKQYRKMVDMWQKPLEKKRLRRERRLANPPQV